jgi:hypothetical protein
MRSAFSVLRVVMMSLALLAVPAGLSGQQEQASPNPVPLINQPLVPDVVAPGGSGFTLTVNGTGFVPGSVVNWNGLPLATTLVTGSQLTASVPATDVATANTASVTVVSPAPGGGTSNVTFFAIHIPMPVALGKADDPTGTNPHSAITADFNDDGKLDVVTADRSDNTVSVLLGNGDGTFQSRTPYPTANGPLELAAGDFDGDGFLDLVVADQTSNAVSILLGNGDGTFMTHVEFDTGREPLSVTVGDFNQDGKLDLAVTNGSDNTVSVLLGNGDGTFQPQVSYATGARPFPSVTGDFNGDGILDLAVGNQNDNSVSILLGKGDGTFQPQVTYAAGSQVYALTTADLNDDGKLDLAVASNADNTVSVLLGLGDGTFQPQATFVTGSGPHSVIATDLNGDGKLDLVVANEGGNSVSVLLGNGDGTFQAKVDYGAGSGAISSPAGDFNQDGRLDLAVANYYDSTISIMLQDGTITLLPPSLNFGVQLLGTRSAARKVTLTNVGPSTLAISSIAITGPDSTDFGEKNNCGKSLAPGASCIIGVAFQPGQLGPRSAALTITDDAPGSPQSVPLSGISVTSGPDATLSTNSLTFAVQLLGTTSPSQPVTLTNWGTQTLEITGGSISSDFGQTDNCSSHLAPGASCTINVTFTPRLRGIRNGTLSIKDNAPNSPQTVTLRGTGTVVELNPGSLNFGTVTVGQSSQPQTTTLTNVGGAALQITNITITGSDPNDFSQINTCDGGVGAGQSCTITVTFTPTQAGFRSADVSVSDNGGGSPQQVSLSGTGQAVLKCGSPCSIIHNECPQTCHFCRFQFQGYVCSRTSGQTNPPLNESFLERNQGVSAGCAK